MDTDRAFLAARASDHRDTGRAETVPLLRFLAGACRATVCLLAFVAQVARERGHDPILIEPRILLRP